MSYSDERINIPYSFCNDEQEKKYIYIGTGPGWTLNLKYSNFSEYLADLWYVRYDDNLIWATIFHYFCNYFACELFFLVLLGTGFNLHDPQEEFKEETGNKNQR